VGRSRLACRAGIGGPSVAAARLLVYARDASDPEKHARARTDVRDLAVWLPIRVDEAIVEPAWEVEDRYGLSFRDSLSWPRRRPRVAAPS
jgi:hypothetical protein